MAGFLFSVIVLEVFTYCSSARIATLYGDKRVCCQQFFVLALPEIVRDSFRVTGDTGGLAARLYADPVGSALIRYPNKRMPRGMQD